MAQLTVKEVHLLIDQGLNSLGLFTEQALLHEQVDFAVNHVVEKHISQLKDTPLKNRNAIESSIVRYLTRTGRFPVNKSSTDRYYTVDLPEGFGELSTSHTIIGLCGCEDTCCHDNDSHTCADCSKESKNDILEGQWYNAVTKVEYNNVWYDVGESFKGVFSTRNAYGTYEKIQTEYRSNIVSELDALEAYSTNALVKNSFRPLLAWDENKFYIYYDSCKNRKEILLELFINYIANYSDALKISWCNNQTLNFPSEIQRYYIDLAIAYIAVINKQEQQNIVNLKQETL